MISRVVQLKRLFVPIVNPIINIRTFSVFNENKLKTENSKPVEVLKNLERNGHRVKEFASHKFLTDKINANNLQAILYMCKFSKVNDTIYIIDNLEHKPYELCPHDRVYNHNVYINDLPFASNIYEIYQIAHCLYNYFENIDCYPNDLTLSEKNNIEYNKELLMNFILENREQILIWKKSINNYENYMNKQTTIEIHPEDYFFDVRKKLIHPKELLRALIVNAKNGKIDKIALGKYIYKSIDIENPLINFVNDVYIGVDISKKVIDLTKYIKHNGNYNAKIALDTLKNIDTTHRHYFPDDINTLKLLLRKEEFEKLDTSLFPIINSELFDTDSKIKFKDIIQMHINSVNMSRNMLLNMPKL